jgi:transposase
VIWQDCAVRDNDGRKLDHKTLEALRIRAVGQVEQGAHPEDVAAALGLHRKTVYDWLAKYREGGMDALKARAVPGRPPKLGGPQLSRLYALIAGQDPRQMQFEFALWTREMVREVIRREFKVALSVVSVGRLLRKLGLSPQRPLHRAYQQDPGAVQRWKNEAYPAIRAEAEAAGATVYFADEAGVRSDYHAGTTWSPVGQTPVVKNTGSRFSVNMISAVSAKGALRFAVYEGNTTAATFIDFCKRLLHDAAGPVYLVVDGHPAHRATATKEFAASTEGRLRLIYLPGYSPELNPDEWVWKERQARPDRQDRCHQQAGSQVQGHRRPAEAAEASRAGPRILLRSESALYHRITESVGLLTHALVSKSGRPGSPGYWRRRPSPVE